MRLLSSQTALTSTLDPSIRYVQSEQTHIVDHPDRLFRRSGGHGHGVELDDPKTDIHTGLPGRKRTADIHDVLVSLAIRMAAHIEALTHVKRLSSLTFETFLFVLTLVKFFENAKAVYGRESVIYIFIRDGTWAFAVIFRRFQLISGDALLMKCA